MFFVSDKFFAFCKRDGDSSGLASFNPVISQVWDSDIAVDASVDFNARGYADLFEDSYQKVFNLTLPCPRLISVNSNKANIDSSIIVNGTDILNNNISEELTINGSSPVVSTKAFKSIFNVSLPERSNVPALQKYILSVANAASSSGDISVVFTSSRVVGASSGLSFNVAIDSDDSKSTIASKIAFALHDNDAISSVFDVVSDSDNVIVTSISFASNDASLDISVSDSDSTGVGSLSGSNSVSGVDIDKIWIGYTEYLGLEHSANLINSIGAFAGSSSDSGVSINTDANIVSKNFIKFSDNLDGSKDLAFSYIIIN